MFHIDVKESWDGKGKEGDKGADHAGRGGYH